MKREETHMDQQNASPIQCCERRRQTTEGAVAYGRRDGSVVPRQMGRLDPDNLVG
jgi:hypothetical protein